MCATIGLERAAIVKNGYASVVYFDNAATTRPSTNVLDVFTRCASVSFGNPSSRHLLGKEARTLIEKARHEVALSVGAHDNEIVFTSGGTEADNLAIQGVCAARSDKKKIIISAVEHPAVHRTCRILRKNGYEIAKITVCLDGTFDEESLINAVDNDVALVSFMVVNNETGTIFPLKRIVEIVKSINPSVPIHTDAVQAFGKIPLNAKDLGVDLLIVSAHKIHGLKGIGALYVSKGTSIFPMQFGGGQEKGLRSGTEAVALIVSFGQTASDAAKSLGSYGKYISELKIKLLSALRQNKRIVVNSQEGGIPHIVNFSIPSKNPDNILVALSNKGYCISRGAACKSNHVRGPSMLMSFGLTAEVADTALRVSFSHENTINEVDGFVVALDKVLGGL